jgi:hypothetical protein
MVCADDYEQDHPQKFLRVHEDKQSVPYVREQNDDTFLNVCYLWDRSPYADLASADCAIVDNYAYTFNMLYYFKNGAAYAYVAPVTPSYTFDGWFLPQYA